MSQPQTMADLTSKKGWVRIKYDQSVWIPILPEYPDGDDWHGHSPCHLAFAHLPDPRHDDGALYAALRYAWRSEEFENRPRAQRHGGGPQQAEPRYRRYRGLA